MGLASSTGAPLPASKSTSLCKAHALGLQAEAQVAEHFRKKSFRVLKQRWRTPYAEVDLLVGSPSGEVWIVEIKTLTNFDFLTVRVSRRQRERLKRAYLYVQGRTSNPVCLYLAFVDAKGEVLLFDEF